MFARQIPGITVGATTVSDALAEKRRLLSCTEPLCSRLRSHRRQIDVASLCFCLLLFVWMHPLRILLKDPPSFQGPTMGMGVCRFWWPAYPVKKSRWYIRVYICALSVIDCFCFYAWTYLCFDDRRSLISGAGRPADFFFFTLGQPIRFKHSHYCCARPPA